MSTVYLLEPDDPGSAWAPFTAATPLSELRAGAWRLRQRWSSALGMPTVMPPVPFGDLSLEGLSTLLDSSRTTRPILQAVWRHLRSK